MISAVTTSTGFFPSNFLFAAQSIMEYNFFNMFYALNQAFSGLSMTYWNQFQMVRRFPPSFPLSPSPSCSFIAIIIIIINLALALFFRSLFRCADEFLIKKGGIHNYLDIGNYFAVVSEVFYQFMLVQPLTESKDMPEQDSWLGNFLTSIPNITFQTFAVFFFFEDRRGKTKKRGRQKKTKENKNFLIRD